MKPKTCTIAEEIAIQPGRAGDYEALAAFHYRQGQPRGVTRVFVARHRGATSGTIAGVIVETLPPLACMLRRIALPGRFDGYDAKLCAGLLNRDLRTISRVIVHPLFRGLGLGGRLVRQMLATAQTPYIEAFAAMGRVHPLFEKAGMRRYERPPQEASVRLLAALEREGITTEALSTLAECRTSPFLRAELRRFARNKNARFTRWCMEARERLGSVPLYYLWRKEGSHREHRGLREK